MAWSDFLTKKRKPQIPDISGTVDADLLAAQALPISEKDASNPAVRAGWAANAALSKQVAAASPSVSNPDLESLYDPEAERGRQADLRWREKLGAAQGASRAVADYLGSDEYRDSLTPRRPRKWWHTLAAIGAGGLAGATADRQNGDDPMQRGALAGQLVADPTFSRRGAEAKAKLEALRAAEASAKDDVASEEKVWSRRLAAEQAKDESKRNAAMTEYYSNRGEAATTAAEAAKMRASQQKSPSPPKDPRIALNWLYNGNNLGVFGLDKDSPDFNEKLQETIKYYEDLVAGRVTDKAVGVDASGNMAVERLPRSGPGPRVTSLRPPVQPGAEARNYASAEFAIAGANRANTEAGRDQAFGVMVGSVNSLPQDVQQRLRMLGKLAYREAWSPNNPERLYGAMVALRNLPEYASMPDSVKASIERTLSAAGPAFSGGQKQAATPPVRAAAPPAKPGGVAQQSVQAQPPRKAQAQSQPQSGGKPQGSDKGYEQIKQLVGGNLSVKDMTDLMLKAQNAGKFKINEKEDQLSNFVRLLSEVSGVPKRDVWTNLKRMMAEAKGGN